MDGLSQVRSTPVGPTDPLRSVDRSQTAPVQAPASPEPIPSSPPAEVLNALDLAQRVINEIVSSGTTLHFDVQNGPGGKRVHVEVRDASGELIREIPPTRLASILAGGGSHGLVVDETG
jgi:uncharacterized FlaG/YvyC family protein